MIKRALWIIEFFYIIKKNNNSVKNFDKKICMARDYQQHNKMFQYIVWKASCYSVGVPDLYNCSFCLLIYFLFTDLDIPSLVANVNLLIKLSHSSSIGKFFFPILICLMHSFSVSWGYRIHQLLLS